MVLLFRLTWIGQLGWGAGTLKWIQNFSLVPAMVNSLISKNDIVIILKFPFLSDVTQHVALIQIRRRGSYKELTTVCVFVSQSLTHLSKGKIKVHHLRCDMYFQLIALLNPTPNFTKLQIVFLNAYIEFDVAITAFS